MRDNLIRAYRNFFLAWIVLLFFLFALLSTFAFAQANLPEIVKKISLCKDGWLHIPSVNKSNFYHRIFRILNSI